MTAAHQAYGILIHRVSLALYDDGNAKRIICQYAD